MASVERFYPAQNENYSISKENFNDEAIDSLHHSVNHLARPNHRRSASTDGKLADQRYYKPGDKQRGNSSLGTPGAGVGWPTFRLQPHAINQPGETERRFIQH